MTTQKIVVSLFAAAALFCALALLTGCAVAYKADKITSIKTRVFGIQVTATDATTGTPKIQMGLVSTVIQLIPTSTNGPIQTPRYFDTFQIDQSSNPFNFGMIENTGSGDVQISTNGQGQAIIPKLGPPVQIIPVGTNLQFTPTEGTK